VLIIGFRNIHRAMAQVAFPRYFVLRVKRWSKRLSGTAVIYSSCNDKFRLIAYMAHHMIVSAALDYLERISGLSAMHPESRLETGWILGELAAVSFMEKSRAFRLYYYGRYTR
jgi:hypothetical protein